MEVFHKGDISTNFIFTVNYYDVDGDPPIEKYVIVDGAIYTMELTDGTASNGTYSFTAKLGKGNHNYYFLFSDGIVGVRLPSTGLFSK